MSQKILLLIGFSICCIDTVVAQTSNSEINQTAIERYVAQAIPQAFPKIKKEDIEFSLRMPPDSALNSSCPSGFSYDWRNQPVAGNNTLITSCQDNGWKAYIPVQIEIYQMVVIAVSPLDRNTPINSSSLGLRRTATSRLRTGFFTNTEELNGFEVKRTVKTGQVITPYIAKAPALVERGEWVTIISGTNGLRVTSVGEALKDGSIGDQIPVKNIKSDTRIKAWVIQEGVVSTTKSL